MIIPLFVLLISPSCASENEIMDTSVTQKDSFTKYNKYSEMPIISILYLAQ